MKKEDHWKWLNDNCYVNKPIYMQNVHQYGFSSGEDFVTVLL